MPDKSPSKLPRLLIEEWLPAAAIGVECMRERGTGQNPPNARLHVWWARRPLTVSRAAVLGSLLPADFPRGTFERLLGFGKPGADLVKIRALMDTGYRVPGGFECDRAFKNALPGADLKKAHEVMQTLWGELPSVIDPMAGGGSIPLEAARVGCRSLANEYNPVACTVLEATVDFPFRYGEKLAERTRAWGKEWLAAIEKKLAPFYPKEKNYSSVQAYIFARTVPCPTTRHPTPLVPDWRLLKEGEAGGIVAVPVVDKQAGTWTVEIKRLGTAKGQVRDLPAKTYVKGKGISLFSKETISSEYIKAAAQEGKLGSALYAVAYKGPDGLAFRPPEPADLDALEAARRELARVRPDWEKRNLIPTELYPAVISDPRPRIYGMPKWADMFSPRQLLALGTLVEELEALRPRILDREGPDLGGAVVTMLAMVVDKYVNHNCIASRWESTRLAIKGRMDRHDFSFKATHAEMAPCSSGGGLSWSVSNVMDAFEDLSTFPRANNSKAVSTTMGSATNLFSYPDKYVTAVVVDPPYDDNVQYSELADFFYVWLKRTVGWRRPEWFSSYLCDHSEEAVVNTARHKKAEKDPQVKDKARAFYRELMRQTFSECRRILRDDGALTVMFTHKKQEAWEALFSSLIQAGFTISATWPVKTESEHSLNQARKNAAQSTVLLVARKRPEGAGIGYFTDDFRAELEDRARSSAERLAADGLNAVDQLVGSFGPAMEVYSRYDQVRTNSGDPVPVGDAISLAADAVSRWRIDQLAKRGLEGVEPEGRFALLCWDVLGAAEFPFNEAKLLGHAVRMEVDQLTAAGLVSKKGETITLLSAQARRRERPLQEAEVEETLFGPEAVSRRGRGAGSALKVHPNDPRFRTALDACHALALRVLDAGGGAPGIGSARSLARQQRWEAGGPVARLMEALVLAAPEALRFEAGKKSMSALYPEFRIWRDLLEPLFGVKPPEWKAKAPPAELDFGPPEDTEDPDDEEEDSDE